MLEIKEFLKKNKDKIDRIAGANTVRDDNGLTVLTEDDPCRDEDVWDKICLREDRNCD